jgi:hypothetical protein
MNKTNKKVIRRFRIRPPRNSKGERQVWTSVGAEECLYRFVGQFDFENPGNRYRLVPLAKHHYRLVWEANAEDELNA